ncbi:MAG: hypothetical protein IJU75_03245 [Clostridia bacterium]|nr:hypothetical protein [Clostridia bacterium]
MDGEKKKTGKAVSILFGVFSSVLFYSSLPAFYFLTVEPDVKSRLIFYVAVCVLSVISFFFFFRQSGGSAFFGVPYFSVCILFSLMLFAERVSHVITDGAFALSLTNGVLLLIQIITETRKYLGGIKRDDAGDAEE